jgi:hypothetical protein
LLLTREEFEDWLIHPGTKALKDRIKRDVQYMQDMLVDADLDSVREIQGRCKASINLLDINYEDLHE